MRSCSAALRSAVRLLPRDRSGRSLLFPGGGMSLLGSDVVWRRTCAIEAGLGCARPRSVPCTHWRDQRFVMARLEVQLLGFPSLRLDGRGVDLALRKGLGLISYAVFCLKKKKDMTVYVQYRRSATQHHKQTQLDR